MRLLVPALLMLTALSATAAVGAPPIDFSRDVRPIFNRHCVGCHGGVKQASGVSFVYREQVVGRGNSGEAIVVPGDPAASELIRRVRAENTGDRMPPVDEHPEGLANHEIATLTRWVEEGAAWSDHWSFVPPKAAPLPAVADESWCRTAIDRFVLARLEWEGVSPALDADAERWLRRVTLDLVGLPPTPEQRAVFLEDVQKNGEAAYDRAVDRLLMSPRFGERWASVWLDQVRYADSRGLGQDGRRNIWKYRDWVIEAFNRDMPYDEFTIQQIAGDLLPNANIETRLATAVHRLTQQNEEGGTDDEEFRVAAVLDRVNTLWQTWQGLTFGCVQCHSHPYEPFRQEDYYRFAAFFNNTADCDLDEEWPTLAVPLDPADYPQASELDDRIAALEEAIWHIEHGLVSQSQVWRPLRIVEAKSSNDTRVVVEPHNKHDEFHTEGTVSENTDFTLVARLPDGLEKLAAIRLTAMPLDPRKAVADSEWGFVLSRVRARLVLPGGERQELDIAHIIADEPHPFMDPRQSLSDSRHGFSAYTRIHYPRHAALVLAAPLEIEVGSRLEVDLTHRMQALGAFPLVMRRGHLAVTDDPRVSGLSSDDSLNDLKPRLAALQSRRDQIRSTPTPVLTERPPHLARPTHVFERGLFLTKAQQVSSGVPDSMPPLRLANGEDPPDRLDLAQWLVSPENPLTARVAVNRFWARLFGVGLVETEEDFGSSGEPPSHRELLDYLALRFRNEHAWSVKSLLRELVLSRTYRQSSRVRSELYERDPQNRLLATGPRQRLSAEIIRDQALAVSGLLSARQFGPPVHPPLPDGVWQPFQAADKWPTAAVGSEDRYRRSIYTYTKRTIPFPMFAAFDAPSREVCMPRRLQSNTPLQALMTLNDEAFLESAQALARRMRGDASRPLEKQLATGYELAAGVECNATRLEELMNLYERTLTQYRDSPGSWTDLASSAEEAAMAIVASVLLNLDEVVTK